MGDYLIWDGHIQSMPKIKRNKSNYIHLPNYKSLFLLITLPEYNRQLLGPIPFTDSKIHLSIQAYAFPPCPNSWHPQEQTSVIILGIVRGWYKDEQGQGQSLQRTQYFHTEQISFLKQSP